MGLLIELPELVEGRVQLIGARPEAIIVHRASLVVGERTGAGISTNNP